MAIVQGVVQEVRTKQTSFGPMYDIVVDGVSYGAGKFAPKAKAGDVVEFDSQQKGNYNNITPKTLRVTGTGSAPAPRPAVASAPARGNDFGKNQEVISRQAARNSAIAFLNLAHAAGSLPLGAASAKVGDKFDALDAMCDKLTEKFFNHSQGVAAPSSDKPVPAAPPADGDDPW